MKAFIFIIGLTTTAFLGCTARDANNSALFGTPQNEDLDKFEFSFKLANAKAKALMTEEFYWSPIEETSPFGNDEGSDAAYGFRQWRMLNKTSSPVNYLNELIKKWNYPVLDYNEMDTSRIKTYFLSKGNPDGKEIEQRVQMMKTSLKNSADSAVRNLNDEQIREVIVSSSKELGPSMLMGQDNATIAIGFAQFVLEGHVDDDMKAITTSAIKRELLPFFINRYDASYRDKRKQQLTKMLEVINMANL